MRAPAFSLLAILGLAVSTAYAEGDASDQFLDAFLNFQRGEKAESAGKSREALTAYNRAIDVLDAISARYPDWNPAIVKHRREKAAAAVARLQTTAGPSSGRTASRPPAGAPGSVEPELPTRNESVLPPDTGFPDTSVAPAPTTPKSSGKRGAGSADPIQEIQSRIESLQKDLTATRDRLDKATQEKEDLAKKYDKALRDAKEIAEKMEVVQKRADRAESALLEAEKSGNKNGSEIAALRKEASDARRALRQLQIERDAEAELSEQIAGRVAASRNQLADVAADRDAARKGESDAKRENADIRKQLDAAIKTRDELTAKLSKTEAELGKAVTDRDSARKESGDVPKKLAEMQKRIDQALKEKTDLETKLTKVQEQLNKVTGERDDALAQVAKMREASKDVTKLLNENTQLMAKLQDAEKQIAGFKAEGAEKDRKIAELTKDLTTARTQLAETQKQSAEFQARMDDLRTQLETQGKELAAVKADAEAGIAERKRLTEENDLLRGIVLRQQKEQAHRDRVKKLVLEQLAKLEINSKAMIEQVELLGSPVVKLTEKERKLFKEPQLTISDTEITFSAADAQPNATPASATPAPAEPVKATTTPAPVAEADPKGSKSKKTAASKATPTPAPTKAPEPAAEPEPLKLAQDPTAPNPNKLDVPLPDSLPNIAKGVPKDDKKGELASAKGPKGLPGGDSSTKGSPVEGDLPTKEKGSSSTSGPGVKTGLDPAVPAELSGLAREAKDHFERGNYREAEKIYEKALAKAPNNLYVLSNLGVVRFRQQKYKGAEEAFQKAIAVAPEDDFSHCTLGIVYYQKGEFDHAIGALTRALAINPKNATAHNYLGITASQKGWQESALKELETATSIDPNYADAHFNLAVVFATQSPPNKDEARKHYKRAVELGAEPDSALEQLLK